MFAKLFKKDDPKKDVNKKEELKKKAPTAQELEAMRQRALAEQAEYERHMAEQRQAAMQAQVIAQVAPGPAPIVVENITPQQQIIADTLADAGLGDAGRGRTRAIGGLD